MPWLTHLLALLGHDVAESTVAKYTLRHRYGFLHLTRRKAIPFRD